MDKTAYIALWDAYGALMTKTQYEICSLYFNYDLTVSEISVEKGISRQAVSDCLKGCEKQLLSYDEKLKFIKKLDSVKDRTRQLIKSVGQWADKGGDVCELKALLVKAVEETGAD